jgi:hypothetical protein
MILLKPYLHLNRLIIFAQGRAVYDEQFKDGVNIIRGANSSGKSTIADFIFLVLGGDLAEWKYEAERCSDVFAEIGLNDTCITLRRYVTNNIRQPTLVFWGPYEQARQSAVEGWQSYPFARSVQKENFSQLIFRALDMPEVKGDLNSNITMHQLLRVIYIDQLSPVDSLMRNEEFDPPLTRSTVGDMLLGVYDDTLYSEELAQREKQRDLEEINRNLNSLLQMFGDVEQEIDLTEIEKTIEETQQQLARITVTLESSDNLVVSDDNTVSQGELNSVRQAVSRTRQELFSTQSEADNQEIEVADSRQFIATLEKRISALDQSLTVRDTFGELPLTHCPQCLTPLVPLADNEQHHCILCRQPLPEDTHRSQILRMRQELAIQIKESQSLLEQKTQRLVELRRSLPELEHRAIAAESAFNDLVNRVRTKRDREIDTLLIKKGSLENQLEFLLKQAKGLSVLESLKSRRARLASEIQDLGLSIHAKRNRQAARINEGHSAIEKYTLQLLRSDLPREDLFSTAQSVSLDFRTNSFAVDGRNQFSASSMTYLKNSVHFAILFASLDLEFFRYPRFLLCDNTEDKGMEEARSQNFQRVIVDFSKNHQTRHQIIFTTSMIAPELDNSSLCIGPAYSKEKHTLDFGAAS